MFNQCNFIGNVTKDPESKVTQSGTAVTSFSIAVNSKSGDKEETLFLSCTAFGKLAEIAEQYLHKGKQILVSGRLQEQKWEKDGEKKSRMVLITDIIRLLGKKEASESSHSHRNEPEPF